jgi:mono/diheme cytochrome c family protein
MPRVSTQLGKKASVRKTLLLGWIVLVSAAWSYGQAPRPQLPAANQRAFLDQYCVGCHNQRAKTAGLMLDKMDVAQVPQNAEVWEKVVRKLRAGMMPPSGVRRPDRPTIEAFATRLEAELDRSAAAKANPGAPALHRLNRNEYANAIRDLLSLEIDPTSLLPADDSSSGFDNNADALGVSPA